MRAAPGAGRATRGPDHRPDLPAIEGVNPIGRLRRAGIATPVLVLTARGTVRDRVEVSTPELSTIEPRVGDGPDLTRWRKRLFVATTQITADAAEYFGLPREQTIITGSRVDV